MYTGIIRCVICGWAGVVLEDNDSEWFCENHVFWANVKKEELVERLEIEIKRAVEVRDQLLEDVREGRIKDFTYHEEHLLREILRKVKEWDFEVK